jgi:hypothetical protein
VRQIIETIYRQGLQGLLSPHPGRSAVRLPRMSSALLKGW